MQNVDQMLDKIKEMRSIASDNALAGVLGQSRQNVSNWRRGRSLPDAVACARIAEAAEVPLARVLGIVGEARAISREEKAVWRRLAAAAAVVLMAGFGGTGAPSSVKAKNVENSVTCEMIKSIHYGSIVQFVRRARQLLQNWMGPCRMVTA